MVSRRFVPCALLLVLAGCSYSSEVKKSIERVLKQDFSSYHFFATPAGNFGAGTMYLKSANGAKPSQIGDEALIAIQDTYFASDVPPAERDALLKQLFPDGKIGQFSVSEKMVQGVALDVAVPGISGVLNASGNVDLKKGVEVELQAGETAVRKLNWLELRRARESKKIATDVVQHLDARDVMIAMNDIIVRGYTATVKLDATANAGLKAELEKAADALPVTLPSGKTSFSRGQKGTYQIKVTEPVVVAVLFKEIPVGALAGSDSDSWPTAKVSAEVIARLQQAAVRLRADRK